MVIPSWILGVDHRIRTVPGVTIEEEKGGETETEVCQIVKTLGRESGDPRVGFRRNKVETDDFF